MNQGFHFQLCSFSQGSLKQGLFFKSELAVKSFILMVSKAFGEYLNIFYHIFLAKTSIISSNFAFQPKKLYSVHLDTGYNYHLELWHRFWSAKCIP